MAVTITALELRAALRLGDTPEETTRGYAVACLRLR